MISRITLFAVAFLGLVPGTALSQVTPTDVGLAAEETPAAGDCIGLVCDGCTDCGCDEWVTGNRFGLRHNRACDCPLCRPRHAWASAEALMWWGKGRSTVPLATSGTNGILPNAPILFGDGSVGNRLAAGARADFGFWVDDCENLGVGLKVWGLNGDSSEFHGQSLTGSPVLARPFYNVVQDQEDAFLVASPGLLVGTLAADTNSSMLATEAYLRSSMFAGRGYNIDFIGGYHFLRFDNDLSVFSNSMSIDPAGVVPVGTIIDVLDEFNAENEFHGGMFGLASEARYGKWSLGSVFKCSVGNMRQTVGIDGYQSVTTPNNASTITPGGILAQPTNMGTYERDVTAWIPELTLNVGYDVRNWLRFTVGYNALWISNAAFAGDQIDYNVNPTQFGGNPLIGPASPSFTFQENDYWLHGLTIGGTLLF
jgi:hypothetical protein